MVAAGIARDIARMPSHSVVQSGFEPSVVRVDVEEEGRGGGGNSRQRNTTEEFPSQSDSNFRRCDSMEM